MSGVQVGIRVRPFIPKIDGDDQLCVSMTDTQTTITDVIGDNKEKKYTFDYSFWTHDEYHVEEDGYCRPDEGGRYKDQDYVFKRIGIDVLDNAWNGYHCCLFAYGQTGAGKSYSMIGGGANRGIVPRACNTIFERIKDNDDAEKSFEVSAMMCEIYNEKVQDLMIPVNKRPANGLKVRESKALGIFVDGLSKHAVNSFEEISKIMDIGESHRSKGATLMNAESSRAHTVIQIEFKQIITHKGKKAQKVSVINLIDLAGSEKAGQTGATGDRLKEGCEINKSLSCLGDVIKALVDKQNGKKNIVIPYRNSNLTRMLQNALGGNSKTYMICAIRPGAKYFEETNSTLRYADRAKQIKNAAVVNEDPQDKLIRELKEENDRLKKQLAAAGGPAQVITKEDEESKAKMAAMQEQLEANQRAMLEMEKSWEEKLAEAKAKEEEEAKIKEEEERVRLAGTPHLVNLNEDPFLDRKVVYDINDKEPLTCGRRGKNVSHKLQLGGIGIEPQHAEFRTNADGSVSLVPLSEKAMANCKVNGKNITSMEGIVLKPNDRICLGPSAMFLFKNEDKKAEASMEDNPDDPISYDFACEEVAKVQNSEEIEAQMEMRKKMQEESDAKIKALEEKLERDKQANEDKIKQMEANLANAAEEEKAAQEAALEKAKQANEQLAKDKLARVLAEGIRQKALQAEYSRVEKQLGEILPLVNEANIAATDLGRDIKFNTKMVKKIDPFLKDGQMKSGQTEIVVKVDNNEDKYFYEWPAEKFRNRLYIIKDVLEEFFDTGKKPSLEKDTDPFWDPPNPILIGQSFLQLEPLGYFIENNLENAKILTIDGAEGYKGEVCIGYMPCDKDGNEGEDYMPEEFEVEELDDLVGKQNLYFKVFVRNCKNLPKEVCCNPYVTYQLRFDKEIYRTPEIAGINSNPDFNYSKMHCIEHLTDDVVKEIKTGSLNFMVYAYPNIRATFGVQDDGGAALKRKQTQRRVAQGQATATLDPDEEAELLGLDSPETKIVANTGSGTAPKRTMSMKDKEQKAKKKEELMVKQQELNPGQGGKVHVVEKGAEGSACCTIF